MSVPDDNGGATSRLRSRSKSPRGLPAELADVGHSLVMGILNVTPDSFSDGGRWLDAETATQHGLAMMAEGADLVDVGGESTRPGAPRVSVEDEIGRVVPVIAALSDAGVPVSVDTLNAATAERALAAGAVLVNDVSGGLADPDMVRLLAEVDVPYVAMHWRGHSEEMQRRAVYDDVVGEVLAELRGRLDALADAGVDPDRVVLDPGLGFAKLAPHNWSLLARLDALQQLGRPLLIGASRKRFLGELLAGPDGEPAPVGRREAATVAISTVAATAGVWALRVHDVRPSVDAVRVASAIAHAEQVAA